MIALRRMARTTRMTPPVFGRALTLLALTPLALGLAPVTGAAQDSVDAAVRDGRSLFESQQCWQCHGYEGQGGAAGVRIAPTLYPFEAFARLVRHTNVMPAYSPNVLSDDQLRLIFAYVSSIPEPPPLEEIPELNFDR